MEFTFEYWKDGDWLVGQLIEAPGVFSQGKTLTELEADHVIPWSKGEKTKRENLRRLCRECNQGKGNIALSI